MSNALAQAVKNSGKMGTGAKIGIAFAVIVFIVGISLLIAYAVNPDIFKSKKEGDVCEGEDVRGTYEIDEDGDCVLTRCSSGWEVDGDECVKKESSTTTPSSTTPGGIAPSSTTPEGIAPSKCWSLYTSDYCSTLDGNYTMDKAGKWIEDPYGATTQTGCDQRAFDMQGCGLQTSFSPNKPADPVPSKCWAYYTTDCSIADGNYPVSNKDKWIEDPYNITTKEACDDRARNMNNAHGCKLVTEFSPNKPTVAPSKCWAYYTTDCSIADGNYPFSNKDKWIEDPYNLRTKEACDDRARNMNNAHGCKLVTEFSVEKPTSAPVESDFVPV